MASKEEKCKAEKRRKNKATLSASFDLKTVSLLHSGLKGEEKKQHFRQEMSIIQKCNIIMCLNGLVYQTAFSGKDVVVLDTSPPLLPSSFPPPTPLLPSSLPPFFFLQDTSNFPGFATTYMSFLSVFI